MLTSRRLWINLALITLVVGSIVFGTLFWLESFTRHGETVGVPDLRGYSLVALDEAVGAKAVVFEITDSIYSNEYPRGTVVQQTPEPGLRVKEGRTIYLTVNSTLPEMVKMPDLRGKSRRIAIPLLEISGLRLDALLYKPDDSCTDCVIDQLYNGVRIKPGESIKRGDKVSLVLGQRSNVLTEVPEITGLTYENAYILLNAYSLNMGLIIECHGCMSAEDTAAAFVIGQLPKSKEKTSLGSFIDLYLSTDSSRAPSFVFPMDSISFDDDANN